MTKDDAIKELFQLHDQAMNECDFWFNAFIKTASLVDDKTQIFPALMSDSPITEEQRIDILTRLMV